MIKSIVLSAVMLSGIAFTPSLYAGESKGRVNLKKQKHVTKKAKAKKLVQAQVNSRISTAEALRAIMMSNQEIQVVEFSRQDGSVNVLEGNLSQVLASYEENHFKPRFDKFRCLDSQRDLSSLCELQLELKTGKKVETDHVMFRLIQQESQTVLLPVLESTSQGQLISEKSALVIPAK